MKRYSFLIVCMALTAIWGCESHENENVALRINDHAISSDEFNEKFTEMQYEKDTPKVREEFLSNLINRKLLLQEAERLGLNEDPRFLASIEHFWEQSLLKVILEYKTKELSQILTVSEEEIKEAYARFKNENPGVPQSYEDMRSLLREQLLRMKQTVALNSWVENLKKNASISIDKPALGLE